MTCIFCSTGGSYNSVAHIVPESLGGKHSPIGRPGVTCEACNQYFGQKIESQALRSFPFICFRLLVSVPSKKGRMPSVGVSIGDIHATGKIGTFNLEPRTKELSRLVVAGEVTQLRIIAEVTEPLAVCRMLLKIGLEQLGKHFYEVAVSDRVPAVTQPSESSIEIVERGGILISVMHMAGLSTIIPLERGILPPAKCELPEPEYRAVFAAC